MRCINVPCKNEKMKGKLVCENCYERAKGVSVTMMTVPPYQLPDHVTVEPFIKDAVQKPKKQTTESKAKKTTEKKKGKMRRLFK